MNQQAVLIIADQSGIARDIVNHWQMERTVPAFTLMSSELFKAANSASCDLAIICGNELDDKKLSTLLKDLEQSGCPCICIAEQASVFQRLRNDFPRVLTQRTNEDWLHSLVVLGSEVLRRVDATARVRRADNAVNANQCHAALGRYMLDSRHSFNNALTSVLGNAELLMLDAATLPEEMREQVDTIHSMALRLHEMMQRFSSLETEMTVSEKDSVPETKHTPQAYASGS